jgi:Ca2+/Na+ antiporter
MSPLDDVPPVPRGCIHAVIFVASLFLLERSADIFVDNAAALARRLSIPAILIGLLTAGAEWEEVRPP